MKIVYAGDFRRLPNWGCRATGVALSQMLQKQHTLERVIGAEIVHWTGWQMYAEPPIHYRSRLPRRVHDYFWRKRATLPQLSQKYFKLERTLGTRLDFVSESINDSVREFHSARKEHDHLELLYQSLQQSDALVFNGEGTMIFSTPVRRDVLYCLVLIRLALDLGRKVFFLNAMFSDCPQTGRNEATLEQVSELFPSCSAIVCRDATSYAYIKTVAPNANVTTIPDALFTWKDLVRTSGKSLKECPDLMLPFGSDDLLGKLNLRNPYICLSGSSSAGRKSPASCIEIYKRVANAIKEIGLPLYLVATCEFDRFLYQVGADLGLPVIKYDVPVVAGAGLLAEASLFISGRFHPSIMASLGGTPCVFFGSNSHKTRTLQDVLEYKERREFSDLPEESEIPEIISMAKHLLAAGPELRRKIAEVVDRRSQEATRVLDVLDGKSVERILL